MLKKKILIFYNSIGLGHKSIAENIAFYLEQGGFEVQLGDILKVQESDLARAGAKLYRFFLKFTPWVWRWLYTNKWFTKLTLPYRTKVAAKHSAGVLELLNKFNPDMVICTHTNASAILAYLKEQGKFNGKFGIAFSDFHLHRYWLYWQADFYLANILEQKQEMVKFGIAEDKVFICGMTLKPKLAIDRRQIKAKLGIKESERVVLVASGSLGLGVDRDLVEQLSSLANVRTVVICGQNSKLYAQLSANLAGTHAIVMGYYAPLEQLYAIADLFISKPGGLSVAEALRWQLPILISHLLPGQEELNYNYLLDKGLVMPEPISLIEEAREEIETGSFRKNLERNPALQELIRDPQVLIEAVKSVF